MEDVWSLVHAERAALIDEASDTIADGFENVAVPDEIGTGCQWTVARNETSL